MDPSRLAFDGRRAREAADELGAAERDLERRSR
jgi:hypothetical protein